MRLATVTLSGAGDTVVVTSLVTPTAAQMLVADAVQAAAGARPASVTLAAPDRVTVRLGSDLSGRLRVLADGTLVVRLDGGPLAGQDVALLHPGGSLPFTLVSVTVTSDGSLRIEGSLSGGLLG
jgi:hypothetical protein